MYVVALLFLVLATRSNILGQQLPLNNHSILSLTFDRSGEPIIYPRGNVRFVLPPQFLLPQYSNLSLIDHFGSSPGVQVVEVREDARIPDFSYLRTLQMDEPFSLFIPLHRKMAARLLDLFMEAKTTEEFITLVLGARAQLNADLVNYAQSVALLHRPDTQNVPIPNFACIDPGHFVGGPGVYRQLRERSFMFSEEQRSKENFPPIDIPKEYSGTDLDVEHRVGYFREDIGVNLFYWNWHLVYPSEGPINIVNKDRRGELFYYLHQQIVARYNFERFSNKLGRVKRFMDWREPIEEAYFPKLDSALSSRVWPPRQANSHIKDLARPNEQLYIDIQDLERWRERIFQAIHEERVQNANGSLVPLTERTGTDMLGNLIESSKLSINSNLYGNLHNIGHLMIGYLHDPDNRYLENFGVIGDSATAMRDPVFYKWHAFIDDLFQGHKKKLPSYNKQHLGFNNVVINKVSVHTTGQQQPNVMNTFWQRSLLNLSRGLDFLPQGQLFVRVQHLQHMAFTYNIQVQNTAKSGQQLKGTVRIFMAPRLDERGFPIRLEKQRHLFIELDKFAVTLKPGDNVIMRTSNQSSVTIPYKQTFHDYSDRSALGTASEEQYNFCSCGWPAHLLIPKGSPEGLEADLFVMISNYIEDQVNQRTTNTCRSGSSYCGIRGELYPDRRAMGFPFDRPPSEGIETLDDLTALGNGNIATIRVKIHHTDHVIN